MTTTIQTACTCGACELCTRRAELDLDEVRETVARLAAHAGLPELAGRALFQYGAGTASDPQWMEAHATHAEATAWCAGILAYHKDGVLHGAGGVWGKLLAEQCALLLVAAPPKGRTPLLGELLVCLFRMYTEIGERAREEIERAGARLWVPR